jgi:hypothetical protein
MCDFIDDIPIVGDIIDSIVDIVEDLISWIIPIPDIPDFGELDNTAKGVLLNKRSSNSAIPIIYGTRKVGGNAVFLETSGTDNEYLYLALILGEGEIEDITSIFVNDNIVTWSGDLTDNTERTVASNDANFFKADPNDADSSAESLITVRPHYGADDQTACALISTLSSWTSNHRLRGLAYISLKFKWNTDAFGGVPQVHALVKGKKIYNPNLDGTKTGGSGSHREDTTSTWEYSDNPVYQLLDYLRNARFGMGIANSYFDTNFADWQTAGDVCDANITPFANADSDEIIDLMDSHAVVDTSRKAIQNVKQFLTGCRGLLNYTSGLYRVLVETSGSASIILTEDNIIGGINVSSKSKNSRYNRVLVAFINPDKNYQSDEVQYPPIDDSNEASADQHANMKTADGGILLEGRFDFPTITNVYQAREMAEIILRRSRSSLNVTLKADGTAMDLSIGDIVNITHATPSFSAKPFRVQNMTIHTDMTVSLTLTEHQDSYYTFGTQQEVATIPDTTLPNPFSVSAPASVTLSDELIIYNEGTAITRLNIVVGASPDKFVQYYQVEAKLSTESTFKIIGKGNQINYEMLNVIDDKTYNVRVKSINALGVSSTYTSANRKIVGATEPPEDVKNFSVNMQGSNQMQLNWDSVTDLDISYYEIRYQNVQSGSQWNKSVNWLQVPRTSGTTITTNARTGAFLIKAVDKLGNESNNETIIFSNISSLQAFNNISTLTEDLTLGTYDADVALSDSSGTNSVILDTITDFDDTIGNFDSATGDFDLGGTDSTSNPNNFSSNIDNEGFYTLNQSLTLDEIFDVSFTKNVTVDQIEDPYDQFDDGRGASLFDDAPAPFDGNDPTNATINLQVATSNSSLDAATEFFNMNTTTTYKGRYFKFRLRLANANNKTRAFVSGISITVNMEKRTESENNVVSGTSTKVISFGKPFFATPAIGISAENMASGDFYTISSKSKTGFSIAFTNASSSGISRTFDYVAQGYGLQSSS